MQHKYTLPQQLISAVLQPVFPQSDSERGASTTVCKGLLPQASRPIDRRVGYDWLGVLLLLTLRLSRISKENFNQSGIYPLVDTGLWNQ